MATPGASPGHWPWQAGAQPLWALLHGAGCPQCQRRCLFRRDLLCRPGSPSVGSEYLVDKPWWGAWTPCQEEGLAHARLCPPGQSDGTSVAATAVTPAWEDVEGGSREEGGPVCRRQHGQKQAASGVPGESRPRQGSSRPASVAGTLFLCQPVTPSPQRSALLFLPQIFGVRQA